MARFDYKAGTDGAYTVPDDAIVLAWTAYSAAGGSATIAPGGADNDGVTGDAITIPAGRSFGRDYRNNFDRVSLPQLAGGTVFTFTGTDSYYVELKR